MALLEPAQHRRAFDTLAAQIKQSIALAAALIERGRRGTGAVPVAAAQRLFDAALERYTDLYRRSSFQLLPVGHLLSSAAHTETLLGYECTAHAQRLEQGANAPQAQALRGRAQRHHDRVEALFNTARRARSLDIVAKRPYVMPYRGVYLRPYSPALQDRLVRDRDYFQRWNDGVVAVIQENQIDEFARLAMRAVVLYLNADELADQNMRAQSEGPAAMQELEAEFERRLRHADTALPLHLGEEFDDYLKSLLLRQNVLLRSLCARLRDEHHEAASLHCQPLLDESTEQLQRAYAQAPGAASADPLAALQALEPQIRVHAATWVEHGRTQDTAGLLFQFEGAMQASAVSDQLHALRQGADG